jgi:hypothetical protein
MLGDNNAAQLISHAELGKEMGTQMLQVAHDAAKRAVGINSSVYDDLTMDVVDYLLSHKNRLQLLKEPVKLWGKARKIAHTKAKLAYRESNFSTLLSNSWSSATLDENLQSFIDDNSIPPPRLLEARDYVLTIRKSLRPELTETEWAIFDLLCDLVIAGHETPTSVELATIMLRENGKEISPEAVRQHKSRIRRKWNKVESSIRWKLWETYCNSPTAINGIKYVESLGSKKCCPYRWAGAAGVLGSSLGTRPLIKITVDEAKLSFEFASNACRLIQKKSPPQAKCFVFGILAFIHLLRAQIKEITWAKALKLCKDITDATFRINPIIGFEHAFLLSDVANQLGENERAESILNDSRHYVVDPDWLAGELTRLYTKNGIIPKPPAKWRI